MRRGGAAALLAVLTFGLAACGGSSSSDDSTDRAAAQPLARSSDTSAGAAALSREAVPDRSRRVVAVNPGLRPFSASSPWNTLAEGMTVDSRSSAMLESAQKRQATVEDTDGGGVRTVTTDFSKKGLGVNVTKWTVPVYDDRNGIQMRLVCRQQRCGAPAATKVTTLRIPAVAKPLPQYDGWMTIKDTKSGFAYDLWRARRSGNVISYEFIKRWALNGSGYSPPVGKDPVNGVGARGSGLPLFAGLITARELAAGRIDHALAISVPGPAQRAFVPPASTTDGVGATDSLPLGARLRLKSGTALGKLQPGTDRRTAQIIQTALRRYGAIVVDRSVAPVLYAQRNDNYKGMLRGAPLENLHLGDFEVMQLPKLQFDPPLDTATTTAVQ